MNHFPSFYYSFSSLTYFTSYSTAFLVLSNTFMIVCFKIFQLLPKCLQFSSYSEQVYKLLWHLYNQFYRTPRKHYQDKITTDTLILLIFSLILSGTSF
jgi:hypothetical protein